MQVTKPMLEVAVRKATEAGLFSRRCSADELKISHEVMLAILKAALEQEQAAADAEKQRDRLGRH